MSEVTNILAVVDLVVSRLREAMADRTVEKMAEFSDIEFSQWPSPAVYVIPGAMGVGTTAGGWIELGIDIHVVSVVDNAHSIRGQGGPDALVGTMAVEVIKALQDWLPAGGAYDNLEMQQSQSTLDFAPGRLMFPLSFRTATTVTGFLDSNS